MMGFGKVPRRTLPTIVETYVLIEFGEGPPRDSLSDATKLDLPL